MLLAIDVGNTQTVMGVYEGEVLAHMWRVATNKSHTSDELRVKVLPLLDSEGIAPGDLHGGGARLRGAAAHAGMVRGAASVCWASTRSCARPPRPGELFPTTYANPGEIGADRVADAVAARSLYGAPVVVVDFGTATNIEVVDREGRFIGGVIAPGVDTSAAALFSRATRLAAIDLVDPHTAIGGSTEQAIQAGIVYGEADRVDGLVRRIFAQLGYEAPVVATGGLAPRVAELSQTITATNPELTLELLRLIHEAQGGEWRKDCRGLRGHQREQVVRGECRDGRFAEQRFVAGDEEIRLRALHGGEHEVVL